jgi:cytidylate kinase
VSPAPLVIAVDGPAASGKGTIAEGLARWYGLPYLDSGSLYRAVALGVLSAGDDPASVDAAARAARELDPNGIDAVQIREPKVGAAASVVAAHPPVRAALRDLQVTFARQAGGAVLDGRDIGTVIAPFANAKLFVTASPEVRADRRRRQYIAQGIPAAFEAVLADILARDARDSGRDVSPLVPAPDAVLLDTTDMSIETASDAARRIVEAARGANGSLNR